MNPHVRDRTPEGWATDALYADPESLKINQFNPAYSFIRFAGIQFTNISFDINATQDGAHYGRSVTLNFSKSPIWKQEDFEAPGYVTGVIKTKNNSDISPPPYSTGKRFSVTITKGAPPSSINTSFSINASLSNSRDRFSRYSTTRYFGYDGKVTVDGDNKIDLGENWFEVNIVDQIQFPVNLGIEVNQNDASFVIFSSNSQVKSIGSKNKKDENNSSPQRLTRKLSEVDDSGRPVFEVSVKELMKYSSVRTNQMAFTTKCNERTHECLLTQSTHSFDFLTPLEPQNLTGAGLVVHIMGFVILVIMIVFAPQLLLGCCCCCLDIDHDDEKKRKRKRDISVSSSSSSQTTASNKQKKKTVNRSDFKDERYEESAHLSDARPYSVPCDPPASNAPLYTAVDINGADNGRSSPVPSAPYLNPEPVGSNLEAVDEKENDFANPQNRDANALLAPSYQPDGIQSIPQPIYSLPSQMQQ
ncbi:uncharacterized protein MONOS_1976 [Monocercomonoides exilis]|uniref:uncharacterized protein n=1 Tax=Monocercomonoides exilis TaxID=2049356 RepID=UPI003559DC7C|nr:hypothetical protein MONOS_1976 [Monocercomonoides exilis]|eukprot:MONOS_1976.1-p1 / transcript=MONOS_1976.1 / gene=MONOS_1976 / organism=Monocercomonoides_exilis_PA203 / gene_product=unspecified product / transcript_product=unspecified product / location=Mono_scaffold00038:39388-40958(+) / protein_length=472 / sequence_SO=supercontig / SO=protein_coding / is_pseudo=false